MHTRPRPLSPLLALLPALALACGDSDALTTTTDGTTSTTTELGGESSSSDAATAGVLTEGTTAGSSSGGETMELDERGCWTDLLPGERVALSDAFTGGSEGVAFGQDGRLYVSSDERVWRLSADGARVELAAVPTAIGLARRGSGLVVASLGESFDVDVIDGGVYFVDGDGASEQLTASIASPNFVAITPTGDALISDDFDTRVFRVTPSGDVSEALSAVPSPNGMAYSPDGDALFIASTFTPDGQLTKYDVDADGLPIEASAREILQLGPATTPDGIAVDEDGMVYVAANIRGELWRVDGASETLQPGELVADQLGYPASLAFGDGEGFDRCSVYVTQLMEPVVWRVFIGAPGAPLYD